MDEEFLLPVSFNGNDFEFPAKLLKFGYTFTLEVDIEGTKVHYELDEERNWRVLIPYEQIPGNKKTDANLLAAIAAVIEEITR